METDKTTMKNDKTVIIVYSYGIDPILNVQKYEKFVNIQKTF